MTSRWDHMGNSVRGLCQEGDPSVILRGIVRRGTNWVAPGVRAVLTCLAHSASLAWTARYFQLMQRPSNGGGVGWRRFLRLVRPGGWRTIVGRPGRFLACRGEHGAMAQQVAHLLCKQGVRGSSPLGSTISPCQPPLSALLGDLNQRTCSSKLQQLASAPVYAIPAHA